MGNRVKRYYDVGVAGIHRIARAQREMLDASVLIVSRHEGAAQRRGRLVDKPVIAVPLRRLRGVFGGHRRAAGHMLNSAPAASPSSNIDNGFGAAYDRQFESTVNSEYHTHAEFVTETPRS